MKKIILACLCCMMTPLLSMGSPEKIVTYRVDANLIDCDIIFRAGKTHENTKIESVAMPWEYSFIAESGDYLFLQARELDREGLVITVQIDIDGETVSSATYEGAGKKKRSYFGHATKTLYGTLKPRHQLSIESR